jgi:hypothetical protein
MRTSILILSIIGVAACGCVRRTSAPNQSTSSQLTQSQIAGLPVSLTVKQRSTTAVPGSNDRLSMTVDDITRGQVMVSLIPTAGSPVLGPISMTVDETRDFQFGEHVYSLELTGLNNALVGEDFASFVINHAGANMSERAKIDRLIGAVEEIEDAVFIRNGTEHSPKEAAKHLRDKLKAIDDQIDSARAFIDNVASRSSITGKDYEIRFADGRTIPTRDYLMDELSKLQRPLTTR